MVATRNSNWTTGKIYLSVIQKERRGDYLGPHRAGHPAHHQRDQGRHPPVAGRDVDVVLVEIGGTVGDIESMPFLEAIRQFRLDVGRENTLYIHLTLVPYIGTAGELKTKPTQHSVRDLRSIGIQPDVLLCRTDRFLDADIKRKIALFCDVPEEAVITAKDVDDDLRSAARPQGARASIRSCSSSSGLPLTAGAAPRRGRSWSTASRTRPTSSRSTSSASTPATRTPTRASTRRSITAASRTAPRCKLHWVEAEALEKEGGADAARRAPTASWCPAGSARAARAA